jgi:hypothetical protein
VINSVATPSLAYARASVAWDLPRSLMGGTTAMRLKGKTYLPQEPGESNEAYDNRLSRTTLFNAFRKTVKDMTGKVFARPIVIGDDVPETLRSYCENIDLTGRHLNIFARDVFEDGMQSGISFIMADMPYADPTATRRDDIVSGRRPYLVHIKAEDLIGWKTEIIGGKETLTQVRIRERITEDDMTNPYQEKDVIQIRVLEPGRWYTFRSTEAERAYTPHAEGTTSLDFIPVAPVYINRMDFMLGSPPLEDLADLNVSHWQSQSDQRNILHVARVPILFGAGFDETATMVVGANTMARSADPNAKLTYVEHSGAAIGAGQKDLEQIELQMQAMGLQLLVPKPGQTATGEARDEAKETSTLSMMAQALQDGLEQALGFMAQFEGLGADAGGSLLVNQDFGSVKVDGVELNVLMASTSGGLITHKTYLNELKRRGSLSEDIDVDAEIEALAMSFDDIDDAAAV